MNNLDLIDEVQTEVELIDDAQILDDIISRLPNGEWQGNEFWTLCPFHQDAHATNFSVSERGFFCFVCGKGGPTYTLYRYLNGENVTIKTYDIPKQKNTNGKKSKGFDFKNIVGRWLYHNAEGEVVYRVLKDKNKNFMPLHGYNGQTKGGYPQSGRVLYNLPQVLKAKQVILCEGEKSADAVNALGLTASAIPGGANASWFQSYTNALQDKEVIVFPDNDNAGDAFAEKVTFELGESVTVITLPVEHGEDVEDYILDGHTKEDLLKLIGGKTSQKSNNGDTQKMKITKKFIIDCVYKNELGDARLLSSLLKDKFTYDFSSGKWYYFQGHSWHIDNTNKLRANVQTLLRENYLKVIDAFGGDAKAKTFYDHLKDLTYKSRLNNVIDLSKDLMAFGDNWNSKPYLIACENGVIDLRTGKLRDGQPSDFINTSIPNNYIPDAKAPRFTQFLEEIFAGDEETIDFIQVLFGYGLIGATPEHVLPIFYGPEGFNGKDTLLKAVKAAVGPGVCEKVSSDILLDSAHNSNGAKAAYELADLHIAWASESEDGGALRSARVKDLTGNTTITVKKLYQDRFKIKPKFLLVLNTNFKPKAAAVDDALWKRIILIEFNQHFVEYPMLENHHKIDTHLDAKLNNEREGILSWIVEGAVKYHDYGLKVPQKLRQLTDNYQRENDLLSQFIDNFCTIDAEAEVLQSDFVNEYNAIMDAKVSNHGFGKIIEKYGFQRGRNSEGMTIQGLKLGKAIDAKNYKKHIQDDDIEELLSLQEGKTM
jgi:putative DNA primase/helicase